DLQWLLNAIDQLNRGLLQDFRVVCSLAGEDSELVTSKPSDDSVGGDACREPGPEICEQDVAVVMAERIVDLLEVVEVDEHDGERPTVHAGRLDFGLHGYRELMAVRQSRKVVGGGLAE